MAMTPIRPELGLQDWSPIARGGEAYGRGVGQGLAALGQGIGNAIEKHRRNQKEKADLDEFTQFANKFDIKPDEAKIAYKTAGPEGAWKWLGGIKQDRQNQSDLAAALGALQTAFPAGAGKEGEPNTFSVPAYLQGFSDLGGVNQSVAMKVLEFGNQSGMIPQAMSAKERSDIEKTRAETAKLTAETEKTGAETQEILGKKYDKPEPSEYDKTLARKMAQEAADWTLRGKGVAVQNWQRLSGVVDSLDNALVETGSFGEKMPFAEATRAWRNQNLENMVNEVEGIVYQSLKDTLGAQFTERESQKLVATYINPKLKTPHNLARLKRLQKGMKQIIDAKEEAFSYYKAHGTMDGYTGKDPQILYDELKNVPIVETGEGEEKKQYKIRSPRRNRNG
jgi:hypothetical protein